jgi:diguanylate cyclase (GGDEF)-like protein
MSRLQGLFGYARLRWLLVLTVLLAVMPVFALQLYRLQASRDVALADARERAVGLAQAVAAEQTQVIEKAHRLLELLGGLPAVRYATSECSQILVGIQQLNPWTTTILVANRAGDVLCHSRPGLTETVSIADRPHFQESLLTRGFATSDVVVGRFVHRPLVAASLPALDARGRVEAVFSLGIDLQLINQVAAQVSMKNGGYVLALDRRGNVIAQEPALIANTGTGSGDDPLVRALLSASAPTIEADDPKGEQRIFGIARLPRFGVTIAVGIPREDVLGQISQRFWNDLALLSLVAAGSILAAMLFAELGVLRGVRVLKSAAQRLKAGKIGLRVHLPSFVAGELHDLAATYNAMTAEFERLAYLDRLTGLPNRRFLERQLAERSLNGRGRAEAVLAIDLDGFKPVNDTHGHAVGDRVLTAVARRIASVVDTRGMLARVGGDEFVAIMPLTPGQSREAARVLAEEIRYSLDREPFVLEGQTFQVGCSVGVAVVPDDASTLAGAIVVADAALYEAKRAGRNRVVDNAPPLVSEALAEGADPRPHWACPETAERL